MMKQFKSSLLAATVLVVGSLTSNYPMLAGVNTVESDKAESSTEQNTLKMFKRIEEEWLNAVQFEDKPALQSRLESLIAEDFVYQHGSGQNFTKDTYINLLITDGITVTNRGSLDLYLHDYGDTVITYGSSPMAGEVSEESYDGNLRFINVWRRQPNGDWLLTHRNSELL